MGNRKIGVIDLDSGELVIPDNGYGVHLFEKDSGNFVSGLDNLSQDELNKLYGRLKDTHRFEIFV